MLEQGHKKPKGKGVEIMNKNQKTTPSETEYLLQCGLEPTTIKDLQRSQAAYKKMGVNMTLLEVAQFEIEGFDQMEPSEE
jgi:hypothetical protein